MGEWQRDTTAPRDGRTILMFGKSGVTLGRWSGKDGWVAVGIDFDGSSKWWWWMPIPEPPEPPAWPVDLLAAMNRGAP